MAGPNADGVAPHGDPPVEWDEDTNIRWKVEIPGRGSASPVVWNNLVFLLTAVPTESPGERRPDERAEAPPERCTEGSERRRPSADRGGESADRADADDADDAPRRPPFGRRGGLGRGGFGRGQRPTSLHQFIVLCLDRDTGEVRWQQVATEQVPHEGHHQTNSFASGSPLTDGQRVYASFGSRGIYAYDLEGNLLWQRDLGRMQTRMGFGEGSSPALFGDTLAELRSTGRETRATLRCHSACPVRRR